MFKVTYILCFYKYSAPVVSTHLKPITHCHYSKAGRSSKHSPPVTSPITALYPFSQKPNLRVGLSLLLLAGLRCLIYADENVQEHLYVIFKHEICLQKSPSTLQIVA